MWTLLFLCSVLTTLGVQGAGRYYTSYVTPQPSCRYNCGYSMGSCSCSSSCRYYGNCCRDYSRYCHYSTYAPTTGQPSCRYNCGRHMGSCSCSSSCRYNGNCCHDYSRYCPASTSWPHYTTSQPSCRYNCGYHMGSCSCSSSCQYHGNCCHDYSRYCHYSTYAPTSATQEPCGGYLYGNNGNFSSPNYPYNYPDYARCTWYIRTYGSIVQLNFTDVNIEGGSSCPYDAVYIYDGSSTGSNLLGKLCGTNRATFYSTSAYLTVRFKTDRSVTSSGFQASYTVVGFVQGSCYDNCGNHMGKCSCLYSCQYDGNCCHDYSSYCPASTSWPHYTTSPPSCRYNCGYHMGSCSCSSSCQYNGNCCHDYSWYCHYSTYAPTTAQPSCRYNCGRHMGSCSCSSSCRYNGNCCHDYYSYCSTTTHWPFSTAKPCGGLLFGSGTFSSPNHPNHYQDYTYCIWQLKASHSQRVFLTFNYMELDSCCSCDYIKVYDGSSIHSRFLGRVCNSSQASFYSSSQYMTVLFRTDGSLVGRGFSAEFMSTLHRSSGRVECSSDKMNIVINRNYLASVGYEGHDLYLNEPSCRPYYNSRNEVVFSYPINSCGSVKTINSNGTVIYANNVRAYNSSTSDQEITRQSHFELSVNCRMEKDSVSQNMYIVHNPGNSSIIGTGRFNTTMYFYTSGSFHYTVTENPYQVSLNQYLYVGVVLWGNDNSMVVFLDTCVTSPYPDDFHSRSYYLVRDGCRADSTYYSYSSGTRPYARFRFKAFQFMHATPSVYIQCKVQVCPASDTSSRCRRTCNRRTARDLGSDHDSQTLVLGPIQLKDAEKKEEGSDEQNKA